MFSTLDRYDAAKSCDPINMSQSWRSNISTQLTRTTGLCTSSLMAAQSLWEHLGTFTAICGPCPCGPAWASISSQPELSRASNGRCRTPFLVKCIYRVLFKKPQQGINRRCVFHLNSLSLQDTIRLFHPTQPCLQLSSSTPAAITSHHVEHLRDPHRIPRILRGPQQKHNNLLSLPIAPLKAQ